MLIGSRRKHFTLSGKLEIAREEIEEVDEATFVGIKIDKHLTWHNHIRAVNLCIRKRVGIYSGCGIMYPNTPLFYCIRHS